MVKVQSGQCPSTAPVPPQGALGGSGRLDTPRGEIPGTLSAQPLPRVLELAASRAADVTAFEHAGASAERVAVVGAVAGVVSTILHDSVMVPAETVKQRMQLGYYRNALHCAQAMLASGGGSAWSKCPLGSAPARLLCLLRACLVAVLGSSALPGRGQPSECLAS